MAPEPATAWSVRPIRADDRDALRALLRDRWGSATIVAGGRTHAVDLLPGFVAERAGTPAGFVTLDERDGVTEIVTIDALSTGVGVGTALIDAATEAAAARGGADLVVTTTNDNLDALRFYQRRGFRLRCLRPGAVDVARAAKPSIPKVGAYDIPIRDELELRLETADG